MSRQQQDPGRDVNVVKHAASRRILNLALVLLFPFVLAVASGAYAAGEFAVGGGRSFAPEFDSIQFAFSAHNAPDGTTSGHITLNWPPASTQPNSAPGQLLADVVCLVVAGNAAIAFGVVTKADNPDAPPDSDWVAVDVTDEPDRFRADFGYGKPPCQFLELGLFPVTQGDIVVQD
jgi:hypothetical protein